MKILAKIILGLFFSTQILAATGSSVVCGHLNQVLVSTKGTTKSVYEIRSLPNYTDRVQLDPAFLKTQQIAILERALQKVEETGCDVFTCVEGKVSASADSSWDGFFTQVAKVQETRTVCD